ncbi:hypothetical protein ACE6H2_009115 [Prunus campanulata]
MAVDSAYRSVGSTVAMLLMGLEARVAPDPWTNEYVTSSMLCIFADHRTINWGG